MKNFIILILTFISGIIFSEENANYPEIRSAIDNKNIYLAKKELNKYFPENPNDPSLTFYQAEIWILEGESEYQKSNLRNAYEYFSKAHSVWPSHPTVRRRMEELRGKRLSNSEPAPKPSPFLLGVPEKKSEDNILFSKLGDLTGNTKLVGNDKPSEIKTDKQDLKIVFISDSTNQNEIKEILSEIKIKLDHLKNTDGAIEFKNSGSLPFSFWNLILLSISIVLGYFVFKLNSSLKELKKRIKE